MFISLWFRNTTLYNIIQCWRAEWSKALGICRGAIPSQSNARVLKIIGRKCCISPKVKPLGLSYETLKTKVLHSGSYPQAYKRSKTVFQKSTGLPHLYWTSQFFKPGKHLMANELCAILVKYIKFKKNFYTATMVTKWKKKQDNLALLYNNLPPPTSSSL